MAVSETTSFAWQPLTPRGVAAFARAAVGRLWLVQLLVAFLGAASVVWLMFDGWFPVVSEAIEHVPADGAIRGGQLDWRGDGPQLLAEGRLLAISVDTDHTGNIRSPAHVQIELGKGDARIHSLLGYTTVTYPAEWEIACNRAELQPWWGAWSLALLAVTGLAVAAGLLVLWSILAALYALPVWLLAFFANRELDARGCFCLAGAALMPGALLMAAGILCYDFGVLDPVGLGFVLGAHFAVGWAYLLAAPFALPRTEAAARRKNPFATGGAP